ncbi:MAG: hypothetical protein CVT89_04735 [Candidatus Altiarchaeales archaeon HGW-Altiarchaeales-2]|nr:MAG: hypothetical protein CVT89_04735 [Candidatus Altiarchaeales archaeon HGW-Altiarchaeales-2]
MIYLDASVVVKWFKKGEEFENESLELYNKIERFEIEACASEWMVLEVVRALVKAGASKKKIDDDFQTLTDLFNINAVQRFSVLPVLSLAKNIEYELNMYVADAVHLATAIISGSSILLSEDEHFYKQNVKDYAKKFGLEIKKLKEI